MKDDEKVVAQNLISHLQNLKNLVDEPSKCMPKDFKRFSKFGNLKNPKADGNDILRCLNKTENKNTDVVRQKMSPKEIKKLQSDLDKIKKSEEDMKERFIKSILSELGKFSNYSKIDLSKNWRSLVEKDFNANLTKILNITGQMESTSDITSAKKAVEEQIEEFKNSNCSKIDDLMELQSKFNDSEKLLKGFPVRDEVHKLWANNNPINATLAKQMYHHWENVKIEHELIQAKVCAAMSKTKTSFEKSEREMEEILKNVRQLADKEIEKFLKKMSNDALDAEIKYLREFFGNEFKKHVSATLKMDVLKSLVKNVTDGSIDKLKDLSSRQYDVKENLTKLNSSNFSRNS